MPYFHVVHNAMQHSVIMIHQTLCNVNKEQNFPFAEIFVQQFVH